MPAQSQETVLYSFAGGSDGRAPVAGLTDVDGVFYGTTSGGGANNYGTVFKITASGAESVIHSFGAGSDGTYPFAGLTNVNGVLYGTTEGGGGGGVNRNNGTVFKITTSGAESILHSFANGSDGSEPEAGLTNVDGVLYGTTTAGGGSGCSHMGCGTVFEITTSGTERVLHRFAGGNDAAEPFASLTYVAGVLYGTTILGGGNGCFGEGCGTVFEITTSGVESVLYSFAGGSDGRGPQSLTNVNGVLYGTTGGGGAHGLGTVYKVTTAGEEKVLHSFAGGSDGRLPSGPLTDVDGVLYGTTFEGGAGTCSGSGFEGCGAVFKITTSGVKSAVYRFAGGSDGAGPTTSLTDVNGVLYGTTSYDGAKRGGTVFSLSL